MLDESTKVFIGKMIPQLDEKQRRIFLGGLSEMLQNIVKAQDAPSIIKIFKELVLKAYGRKSPDGKRFIKSEELSTEFSQTEAYSQLFMELATDADAAAKFVNGIVPGDIDTSKIDPSLIPSSN